MANSTFATKLNSTGVGKIDIVTLGGHQSITVCPPPMLKEHPGSTSPHHLFLSSIGSCVNLIFEIALEKARIEMVNMDSDIIGHYETDDETKMSRFTTIEINTRLKVRNGVKKEKLERLFEIAHSNCPIGNCLIGSCIKLVTNLDVEYE